MELSSEPECSSQECKTKFNNNGCCSCESHMLGFIATATALLWCPFLCTVAAIIMLPITQKIAVTIRSYNDSTVCKDRYLNIELGACVPPRIASGLSHAMIWQSPTTIDEYITNRSSLDLLSH